MRRICSKKSDLVTNIGKLKDWFKEKGYSDNMVNKKTKRVLESLSLVRSKTSQVTVEVGYS